MVHGEEEYRRAVEASEILFGGATAEALRGIDERTFLQVFDGVPAVSKCRASTARGRASDFIGPVHRACRRSFPSKGEARKLIPGRRRFAEQSGRSPRSIAIGSAPPTCSPARYLLVQKGKKNYFLIVVK